MNVYRSNTSSCNTLHLEMFLFLSVLFTDFKMINNSIGRIFLSMTNALYRSVDKTSAEKENCRSQSVAEVFNNVCVSET